MWAVIKGGGMKMRNQVGAPAAIGQRGFVYSLKNMHLLALFIVTTSLVACIGGLQKSPQSHSKSKNMPIEKVVQIAMSKARTAGLLDGREYSLHVGFGIECWVVTVEFLPRTFDSELVILVYSAEHVEGPWDRIGEKHK